MTPPSSEPSPSLKLKAFLAHLKYVYLGEQETFPVILASHLNDGRRESRKHKEAIGWTMTDIKGLSLAIVQHRIYLNEEATMKRDPQCRLNLIMLKYTYREMIWNLQLNCNTLCGTQECNRISQEGLWTISS